MSKILLTGLIIIFSITTTLYEIKKNTLEETISRKAEKIDRLNQVLSDVFQEPFELERLKVDVVTVSAYSSEKNQCDSTPYITSTNKFVSPNCVATSRDLPIKKNKHILAVGIGTLRNEDTMNRRYEKALDVWMPDKKAAIHFGIKPKTKIMWLSEG